VWRAVGAAVNALEGAAHHCCQLRLLRLPLVRLLLLVLLWVDPRSCCACMGACCATRLRPHAVVTGVCAASTNTVGSPWRSRSQLLLASSSRCVARHGRTARLPGGAVGGWRCWPAAAAAAPAELQGV
jgi:hypothetical protein